MDNEIKTWLFDIDTAINEIESFLDEGNKIFKNYRKDIKTKRAVERNLEIIGEAVKRVLEKERSIKLTNARKIIDTRNRIIHGYDTISDDVIWGIIINHLPKLKIEIEKLLG
ncbi:MAG: DUF86 domain-containing protein [Chlorobi bacterium]|nr:DUF86 domain-containing protein [Chlorobiota bacterium]